VKACEISFGGSSNGLSVKAWIENQLERSLSF
jgi:hypothetical protein